LALESIGLELRAGLHTGEIEMMGDDIGGVAVHVGARVGAMAGPGEVVVSGTVRDLVVGSDLKFVDRGARVLKGVPGEWRLFALEPSSA
jgi:class 3 adenylate cyclase